ncbi:hypothetical protein V8C86DRAFT_2675360, partial [Haematococcus lacustris]
MRCLASVVSCLAQAPRLAATDLATPCYQLLLLTHSATSATAVTACPLANDQASHQPPHPPPSSSSSSSSSPTPGAPHTTSPAAGPTQGPDQVALLQAGSPVHEAAVSVQQAVVQLLVRHGGEVSTGLPGLLDWVLGGGAGGEGGWSSLTLPAKTCLLLHLPQLL